MWLRSHPRALVAVALVASVAACGSEPEPLTRADEPKLIELCVDAVDNEPFCEEQVERLGTVARVNGCSYEQTAEFLDALLVPLSAEPPDRSEANRLSDAYNEDCSI